MERLSANFFFDDYIARAGSPETAASLLLAELRQTPEACRKEVFFTAGREYHFFAEHSQGFHWHISNHEQAVVQRCAILMEGLKNVTLRGHGARLLMHGCLVPLAIVDCQEVAVEELSIDYPVPSVHQLTVLESNPDADEMLCEVCGETPFRIEDNQFVFEAEGREFRPYWAMPFEASRHLIYQCADHLLYQPMQPTLEHIHEGRITTAEPLPELDASKRWGIENVSWTPEVLFRRNLVRNNRARGALFTTRGEVRCEGNCFDHVHGTAILVCGDCTGWFESGACGKVTITGNDFIDDLTADYEFCEAVVSVAPHIAASVASEPPVHGVIEVTHNRFVAFDAPLLYAHSARKVVFRENAVVPSDAYLPWHPNRRSVTLLGVAENEVEN